LKYENERNAKKNGVVERWSDGNLSISVYLLAIRGPFPLTPALSLRERENLSQLLENPAP